MKFNCVTSFFKNKFVYVISTILLTVVFFFLSLISIVGLYKLVTGETKRVIGQIELQKEPFIIVISFLIFLVIIPIIWRFFVEKIPFNKLKLNFERFYKWHGFVEGLLNCHHKPPSYDQIKPPIYLLVPHI